MAADKDFPNLPEVPAPPAGHLKLKAREPEPLKTDASTQAAQTVVLQTPTHKLASLIKAQGPLSQDFTHIDATSFDNRLGRLPERGCDKEKYHYRWEPKDESHIARFLEGRFFPGVEFRAVTKDNHPQIPDREFCAEGFLWDAKTDQVLIFCHKPVYDAYMKAWNEQAHAGLRRYDKAGKEVPWSEANPNAYVGILDERNASDPALEKRISNR